MPRLPASMIALTCSAALLGACKQHSKEEDLPPASAPAITASAPAAPTATADPVPTPDPIPPPTPPPAAPAAAQPKSESLKTCCAALEKEEANAKTNEKSLYQSAATSCEGIAKLVAAGTTKKAAALTQLRANLKGAKLPAGCN